MNPRVQAIVLAATPQISSDEGGFRAHAYQDSLGIWTWGYGDTHHGVGPGKVCAIADARAWRDGQIAGIAAELSQHIPWWETLIVGRGAALLNMAYQLGVGGMLEFHSMLSALQASDYAGAARYALESDWAKQTPARAQRVAAALRGQTTTATSTQSPLDSVPL